MSSNFQLDNVMFDLFISTEKDKLQFVGSIPMAGTKPAAYTNKTGRFAGRRRIPQEYSGSVPPNDMGGEQKRRASAGRKAASSMTDDV